MNAEWYYVEDGEQRGPVSFEDLKWRAEGDQLHRGDLVWCAGMAEWQRADTVSGLFPAGPPAPPPHGAQGYGTGYGYGTAYQGYGAAATYSGGFEHVRGMRPLSKGFFFGMIIGGIFAAIVIIVIGVVLVDDRHTEEVGVGVIFLGVAAMIYPIVVFYMHLYRIWRVIPPGYARTTPGLAVGLSFIPLFNFYWMFQVYWGWAKDFNRFARAANLPAPRMPEEVALWICILQIVGIVPFVGSIAGIVNFVLIIIFWNNAIDGANAVIRQAQAA